MSFQKVAAAVAGCLLIGAGITLAAPANAAGKPAPACAAVSFRPLAAGFPDGLHEAGMYKSRFSRMELMASVQGGQPKEYFLNVNGKRMESTMATPPREVEACLKSKSVKVPVAKIDGPCTGDRFRVVIHTAGARKTGMLFGLKGDEWHLCTASSI